MTETITATYWYPGALIAEELTRELPDPTFAAACAVDRGRWFAVDIHITETKRFRAADGEIRDLAGKPMKVGRWLIGESMTAEQVRNYARYFERDLTTLLEGMEDKGWERVVLTRCGNWMPVHPGDIVVEVSA